MFADFIIVGVSQAGFALLLNKLVFKKKKASLLVAVSLATFVFLVTFGLF